MRKLAELWRDVNMNPLKILLLHLILEERDPGANVTTERNNFHQAAILLLPGSVISGIYRHMITTSAARYYGYYFWFARGEPPVG